jgi:hypothetical protein
LEDELAQGGHSGGLRGDAELVDQRQQCSGVKWLAGPLAGNSQRLLGLVALVMFCRFATSWSRMPASASGTGEGALLH